MHEMGITQGILTASFDAATNAGAETISEIRISIGELTEIQEFALQFAFEALTPGTMAEGATLVVTHIPATSKCNECGIEYEHDRYQMVCPECGAFNVTSLTGHELQIDSLETPDELDSQPATANSPAPTDAQGE
jgi:hydrogenase nickel incorporation protein HypA/HybF